MNQNPLLPRPSEQVEDHLGVDVIRPKSIATVVVILGLSTKREVVDAVGGAR